MSVGCLAKKEKYAWPNASHSWALGGLFSQGPGGREARTLTVLPYSVEITAQCSELLETPEASPAAPTIVVVHKDDRPPSQADLPSSFHGPIQNLLKFTESVLHKKRDEPATQTRAHKEHIQDLKTQRLLSYSERVKGPKAEAEGCLAA